MKKVKKIIALVLCGVIVSGFAGCSAKAESSVIDKLFTDSSKISYSLSYEELKSSKKNSTNDWRHGMVSGNGMQGFIESGSPYSDTFIFQNMHFIMPNKNQRTCPDTAYELESVKQNIVKGEDIVDNTSYDDVYRFHPGGQLRIELSGKGEDDYVRYTDYETSQVGVHYKNNDGEWDRVSFTSMADGVVITKLSSSSEGEKINATLSFDDLSTLANFGDSDEANMRYKKITDENGEYLALVSHYPNYDKSELKNGGYATLTYVVTSGGEKQAVSLEKKTDEWQFSGENKGVQISGADEVYLITVSDRTYDMGSINSFNSQTEFELVNDLKETTKAVAQKYSQSGSFDYDTALKNHLAIYQPQFDAVTLTLEDSDASNEKLLSDQKGAKSINAALAQRTYYAGRYAYLCCSGYSTSRLFGKVHFNHSPYFLISSL